MTVGYFQLTIYNSELKNILICSKKIYKNLLGAHQFQGDLLFDNFCTAIEHSSMVISRSHNSFCELSNFLMFGFDKNSCSNSLNSDVLGIIFYQESSEVVPLVLLGIEFDHPGYSLLEHKY